MVPDGRRGGQNISLDRRTSATAPRETGVGGASMEGRWGEDLSMTELPYSDDEIVRTLYSPVLSDTLDAMGYRNQAMRPFVRPLDESLVLFGRARTGRYAPV